jgi:hypothetical protein
MTGMLTEFGNIGGNGGNGPLIMGSPATVADQLEAWLDEADIDPILPLCRENRRSSWRYMNHMNVIALHSHIHLVDFWGILISISFSTACTSVLQLGRDT